MKFFTDTAYLAETKEVNDPGVPDSVTTNPSLMAKVGVTGVEAVHNHYKTICQILNGYTGAKV